MLRVYETFSSIQGEGSCVGVPCFFIRLTGCNLHCGYCDTPMEDGGGEDVSADKLVEMAVESGMPMVEITGGEPLLQGDFAMLAEKMNRAFPGRVLVETNGSCDISIIPDEVTAIMDVKCPSSGEADSMDMSNLLRLRPYDEVKFVIGDRDDYEWARDLVWSRKLKDFCAEVLFSPVSGTLAPAMLAEWMLDDCIDVRLQVQLHKIMGVR